MVYIASCVAFVHFVLVVRCIEMERKDKILFAGVIAISLFAILIMKLTNGKQGDYVVIRQNGDVYDTYRLDANKVIEIKEGVDYNRICISNGKAYMEEANCPDGYCMNQHKISKEKETIVCLPHKLVVEIVRTGEENETTIDAVAN